MGQGGLWEAMGKSGAIRGFWGRGGAVRKGTMRLLGGCSMGEKSGAGGKVWGCWGAMDL